MILSWRIFVGWLVGVLFVVCNTLFLASATMADISASYAKVENSIVVKSDDGISLRITPYGNNIVRLQTVRGSELFFSDNHYEMVESHQLGGTFNVSENATNIILQLSGVKGIRLSVDKKTLAINYYVANSAEPVLAEKGRVQWQGSSIVRAFNHDDNEHFTGLGHSYFGRAQSLDLKGQLIQRNYGKAQIEQAPLIVPFFISNKGYGLFLNSTFKNYFNFGQDKRYEFGIDTLNFDGRMDYFFIVGSEPKVVLENYIQLTGKPRLPSKAMFGLQLTDKSHDHTSATPADEKWWKQKITAHRAAGFPLDHVVNDNRWRAGGGKRCESFIEWDKERYPNPAEYAKWLKRNGLVTTLDFNRCIAQYSEGWKPEFNLPETGAIDFNTSAPDLTNEKFRDWFWHLLYSKSLNPALKFPGDALWIDEFDEMGAAPETMVLANGLSSAEMRNYWFFLIAKALVKDGWDKSEINKRPFVWVRGMTAGAQRYATLWSGDIKPNAEEMKMQIRGLQLAGLSGFPYWGHDAGGFFDWETKEGPDESLYRHWSMGFGSFAPIWKPHGMGPSRWPLDRSEKEQASAHKFAQTRYELMPYIYSAAHQAASTGLPMARAMLLEYPREEKAWRFDLQYMWGPDLLVAPVVSKNEAQQIWLPPGQWYNFWKPLQVLQGDTLLTIQPQAEELPVFVKAGAIIPKQEYVLSTALADKKMLLLDVYAGANGITQLVEDDDVTEAYRLQDKKMLTMITYDDTTKVLNILGAKGNYAHSPSKRAYRITLHGFGGVDCFNVNGKRTSVVTKNEITTMNISPMSIKKSLLIQACSGSAER